jgi:hypothetical protein
LTLLFDVQRTLDRFGTILSLAALERTWISVNYVG